MLCHYRFRTREEYGCYIQVEINNFVKIIVSLDSQLKDIATKLEILRDTLQYLNVQVPISQSTMQELYEHRQEALERHRLNYECT